MESPAAVDLGAKFKVPERERGRRDRATMNAKYHLEIEADENGPPTVAQLFRANEQRRAIEVEGDLAGRPKSAGLQPSQWTSMGPSNVGGRVRAIAFDPRNPNRLLAGTASGGLWISDDAGTSWRANFDFLPNLSVTALVFDPIDAANVYLGTGEASAGLVGVGMFKSVDGGNTWRYLAVTNADANPDWRFVNRIAIHPTQPQVLLAALTNNDLSTGSIYRSVDGGNTWTRVSTMKALDIAFDPHTPSNAVAGLDDGYIAFSRDGGLTWARTAVLVEDPSGRSQTARAEIAFARSQPGWVYASVDNEKGQVWKSEDAGATWQFVSTPAHLNNQGDYDNAIWVDPTDADHVIVAGLDIYQSRNGGLSFEKVSDWRNTPMSPHADHHALVSPPDFGPGRRRLFDGSDGGVYRAENVDGISFGESGAGWTNANAGLAVTQFYSGAGRSAAGGRVIGGTQDNGALQLNGGTWTPFRGGDGGYVAVDPANDLVFYGSYVYLSIHRSTNGGFASYICSGITEAMPNEGNSTYCGAGATKKANFIAPFILDPNNPNRLLAGANSLWVTDSAKAGMPSWRTIKAPSPAADNFINAIAVHKGNGNLAWVGHNNGELYRSDNALATTPAWTRSGTSVLPARRVMRITIDPANPQRVIVAFTGFAPQNLWQTQDGGASWASITGNLPAAPIFDVQRHPQRPAWLYAATSVGVFTSEDGGATWSTTNEGPANIRVRELFWLDDQTLVAATYGRGMYKITVPAAGPDNYQDLWWAGAQENGWGMSITQHGSRIFAALYVYDEQGRPLWIVMPGGNWNASFKAFTGALYVPTGSWFGNYDATRLAAGASVGSATITFTSAATASLDYVINGVQGHKSIQRQRFGPPDATPVATFGDLWWGGTAQNGWGIAVSQQYRNLFSVWYTYDAAGRTVWYVVPSGAWTSANVYSGTAYRTTGAPWIGSTYNPAALVPQAVGTVTLTFQDANHATMSYTVEGVTQSKAIVRQPF
ncbi:MAG TPA: hypothetical protein VM073_03600 [Usitatibacter sp.]|nr:hypothetical protein [Usitatibacter sp.]